MEPPTLRPTTAHARHPGAGDGERPRNAPPLRAGAAAGASADGCIAEAAAPAAAPNAAAALLSRPLLAALLGEAEADILLHAMEDWHQHLRQLEDWSPEARTLDPFSGWYHGAYCKLLDDGIGRLVGRRQSAGQPTAQLLQAIEALQTARQQVDFQLDHLNKLADDLAEQGDGVCVTSSVTSSDDSSVEGPVRVPSQESEGAAGAAGRPGGARKWLGAFDFYIQGSGFDDRQALSELRAPGAAGEAGLVSGARADIRAFDERLRGLGVGGHALPLPAQEARKFLRSMDRTLRALEKDSSVAASAGMLALGLALLAGMTAVAYQARGGKWLAEQSGMVTKYGIRLAQVALSPIGANASSLSDFLRYYLFVPSAHVVPFAVTSFNDGWRDKYNKSAVFNLMIGLALFGLATGVYNPHRLDPALRRGRSLLEKRNILSPKPADDAWRAGANAPDELITATTALIEEMRIWSADKQKAFSGFKNRFDPATSGQALQLSANLGDQISKLIGQLETINQKTYDWTGDERQAIERPQYEGKAEKEAMWWTAVGLGVTVTALMPPDLIAAVGNGFELISTADYTRSMVKDDSVSVDQMEAVISSFFGMTTTMAYLMIANKIANDPMEDASRYLEHADTKSPRGRDALIVGILLVSVLNNTIASRLGKYTGHIAGAGAKAAMPYLAPPAKWIGAKAKRGYAWGRQKALTARAMMTMDASELTRLALQLNDDFIRAAAQYARSQRR